MEYNKTNNMKRIKQLIILSLFCVLTTNTRAQSPQTMLDQIVALKALIATAQKGYQIAEDGLHSIRDIKNGEFNLHSAYYASLTAVNPAVKNMPQTGDPKILIPLITDGKYQMTDGERMQFIIALNQLKWKSNK